MIDTYMKIKTSRFGQIEVKNKEIITFPEGLIGFEQMKRFTIVENKPGSPFKWLQSLDDGELAFIIIDPKVFMPGYAPCFLRSDLEALQLTAPQDALMYVTVVVPKNPQKMSANLLGPLVVNPVNALAKQIVLSEGQYTTSHYIVEEMSKSYTGENARTIS
jgi:flagellar assembly factor FliW